MSKSTVPTISYTLFENGPWRFYLAATQSGLCYAGTPDAPLSELERYVHKRFPSACLHEDAAALAESLNQLEEYFAGTRQTLEIAFDLSGTPFQEEVWRTLETIRYGDTCSYSDIADAVGRPTAVRAVASAIGANPLLIAVPCHRVIGKKGALTGYRGGLDFKRFLLALESGAPSPARTLDA